MMGLFCLALTSWTLAAGTPAWRMATVENPSAELRRRLERHVERTRR